MSYVILALRNRVSVFAQIKTHDCVVSGVRPLPCASVRQWQRSSCEEPGRSRNSAPHLVHLLPGSAIKVRQSSTLASFHLWRCAAARPGQRAPTLSHPLPPFVPQGDCHSPVISFINIICSHLPATAAAEAGEEPLERKW